MVLTGWAQELSAVDQFDALTDAVETVLVSLVLCRRRTRFLCVQENDNTWYIPGGTVDAGESFQGAAMRSGLDEANIQIHLDGILRIEYSTSNGVRVRVVFKATPIDPTVLPKQNPDQHSLQAKVHACCALSPLFHPPLPLPLPSLTSLYSGCRIWR